MAVKTILPTTNLEYSDVRDTLNSGGGSVNNNMASLFKEAAKINPFSKKKPVVLSVAFCQDFDESKPNYYPKWWQGADGNCGLTYPTYNTASKVIDAYGTGDEMNGWGYELPAGNTYEPLRLGDFAGYYKNASPIFSNFSVLVTRDTIELNVIVNRSSDNQLGLDDFAVLKDYYFGVIFANGLVRTSTTTIGNYGTTFEVLSSLVIRGDAYPFICSKPQTGTTIEATYIPLPLCEPVYVNPDTVVSPYAVGIIGRANNTDNTISYEITLKSLIDAAQDYANIKIQLRYPDKDYGDPSAVEEQTITLASSYRLQGNETKVWTGKFSSVFNEELLTNGKIWFYANNGDIVEWNFVTPDRG